jgi:Protein of unknown function (DUF1592)/Protein of unknown function (DUF1588)/Protein of unknown function (DUF1587)/Protein of unknown function (DUF1585)/Protein of unknown function (DUF1595)/Planctomycete cytochrome C
MERALAVLHFFRIKPGLAWSCSPASEATSSKEMIARVLVAAWLVLAVRAAAAADSAAPDFARDGRPFLEKHCLGCHSGTKPKGELSLESFRESPAVARDRKVWDNVLKRVVSGEMPPKDRPRPTIAEAEAFTDVVKAVFDHADRNATPDPGRVTMRRLNRVEYRNTIRDLIGVDFDPTEDFPSDDIGYGFDNIGDVLTLPPVLMERYLAAAENILSRAIVPDPAPPIKRHLAAMFTEPASADIDKKVIEKSFRRMVTDGREPIEVGPLNTPYQWDANGEYIFRTRVFGQSGTDQPLRVAILLHGEKLPEPDSEADLASLSGRVLRPARILKTFDVKADKPENAEVLEVRVPPAVGRHRMMVALYKPLPGQPAAKLYVEYFALEGPLDMRPASQHKLLAATPGKPQVEQTREVLTRFLRRAFRRPPTPDELARSTRLVTAAQAAGDNWESGVQLAMQAALCSPKFLFRVELYDQAPRAAVRPLNEFQLASRLAYFLWSTMPDDTLLDLAQAGKLTGQLEPQVMRMLADPRATALVQNFALQWLQIKRLEFIAPDGTLFPTFDARLRKAMFQETELFFESVLREDRSILDLIDADYTFLNEPLAKHYGIADTAGNAVGQKPARSGGQPIRGDEFRRVSLPGGLRGGLLTQASVLTVNSNPTRTSPVKRGRWVLEQILGAPPPPPPANVPELPADGPSATAASLRQQMEVHRRDPACANCHAKMDPIGFALENFNAIGGYRTKDGTFDIDATGEFPDGTRFQGPAELKSLVMRRRDDFARCLTEKMLTYALGRGVEHYDRPTVERIVKSLSAGGYKFSLLVTQIVECDAFRQRGGSDN